MSCVFGPVPSRRLGRSLGVDLVPFKTCTFDCVYCHIGRTPCTSVQRRRWLETDVILRDLMPCLASAPDYITLSGSGEPTLHTGLDEIIAGIKRLTRIPVAIITNGSLLWRTDVRNELLAADLVVPSLDAGDAETFKRINRPAADVDFEKVVAGLIDFRRAFKGQYWLEILLASGINDGADSLSAIYAWTERIAPDKVQLNTVVRPPADSGIGAVPVERLMEIARNFRVPAEIIADFKAPVATVKRKVDDTEIVEMLRRRPCSVEDVADGLGVLPAVVAESLENMLKNGDILAQECTGRRFYSAKSG